MKNSGARSSDELRVAAPRALRARGFAVQPLSGKGIRPGTRWLAQLPKGPKLKVAVRTSFTRSLSFSRLADGRWRTLHAVDLVLCIAPEFPTLTSYRVYAYEAATLRSWFNRALKALESAGRAPALNVPVFIPLDTRSRKNVGHNIAGLGPEAVWSRGVSQKQLVDNAARDELEALVAMLKQKVAEKNGVDVSKVSIEIRILA